MQPTNTGLLVRGAGALLLMAALSACSAAASGPGQSSPPAASVAALQESPGASGSVSASSLGRPAPSGQLTVPLKIAQGPQRATLALVPVSINGKGPFAFALDTGASNSTVDNKLASQLNLPQEGSAGEITGVAAMTKAKLLDVQQWKVGDIQLQPAKLVGVDLGGPNAQAGLAGLLGSDVLSRYGAVTVDYSRQFLVLRAKVPAAVQSAASQAPAS